MDASGANLVGLRLSQEEEEPLQPTEDALAQLIASTLMEKHLSVLMIKADQLAVGFHRLLLPWLVGKFDKFSSLLLVADPRFFRRDVHVNNQINVTLLNSKILATFSLDTRIKVRKDSFFLSYFILFII